MDLDEMNLLWTKLGFEVDDNGQFSDDEIDAVLDEVESTEEESAAEEEITPEASEDIEVTEEMEDVELSNEVPVVDHEVVEPTRFEQTGEISEQIDTEFEKLLLEMEGARFSSERKALMEKQTSEFLVTIKIEKMERTLIGDPKYRGGQSVHGLLDGGPYTGVVKVPIDLDEKILSHKEGDEIQFWASLVDFSPSLKRPVLESSEIV